MIPKSSYPGNLKRVRRYRQNQMTSSDAVCHIEQSHAGEQSLFPLRLGADQLKCLYLFRRPGGWFAIENSSAAAAHMVIILLFRLPHSSRNQAHGG